MVAPDGEARPLRARLGVVLVATCVAFVGLALFLVLRADTGGVGGDGAGGGRGAPADLGIFGQDGELLIAPFAAIVVLVCGGIVAVTWFVAKRMSQAQARTQAQLAALVEASNDAIIGATPEGRITSWNPAATRLYGYGPEEAVGQPFTLLIPEGDTAGEALTRSRIEQVLAGERIDSFIVTRRRKDGSRLEVALTLSVVRDDTGRPVGLSAVARDVTLERQVEAELRRAKEEAEAATRAKAEFLANMSHEIRTPLNAVIGLSNLLTQTQLEPEQREYAETIRLSGDHLLTVINDILDFSKVESGRMELERAPLRVDRIVEEAMELMAVKASEKGLELTRSVGSEVPEWLLGDPGRLRQVLVNLLSNAVKFTAKGEVAVAVTSEPRGGNRHELHVAVRDTGIGIPPERFDRLFKSFSQVDGSTTRVYGGTGLGLAISKQLVELMGGRIWPESELGKGSTFHFTSLLEATEAPSDAVQAGALREVAGLKVLVVDDHPANRRLLQLVGERWGLGVHAVASPPEALEALRAMPFDAAVLDRMMPGMSGDELLGELRKLPNGRALPVVFLASMAGPTVAPNDANVVARLSKPLRQAQLLEALLVAARRKSGRAAAPAVLAASQPLPRLRILLAEDNATNQKVALRMLEKLGQTADVVGNGREAVDALAQRPYDLVFMDLHMPVMDGLAATQEIRARFPNGPRIVAMTADAMEGDAAKCLQAGMDDYVPKPIVLARLEQVLRQGPVAAAPSPAQGAAVDGAALAALRAELGDAVGELVRSFLDEGPRLVDELDAALRRGDAAEAQRAAHTLKGTAATFGAVRLAAVARELEDAAGQGRLGLVQPRLPELRQAMDAAQRELVAQAA